MENVVMDSFFLSFTDIYITKVSPTEELVYVVSKCSEIFIIMNECPPVFTVTTMRTVIHSTAHITIVLNHLKCPVF